MKSLARKGAIRCRGGRKGKYTCKKGGPGRKGVWVATAMAQLRKDTPAKRHRKIETKPLRHSCGSNRKPEDFHQWLTLRLRTCVWRLLTTAFPHPAPRWAQDGLARPRCQRVGTMIALHCMRADASNLRTTHRHHCGEPSLWKLDMPSKL